MVKFLVERLEIWTQPVLVDAANEQDAKLKVADGDGEIHVDAQFKDYKFPYSEWKAEKVEE